MYAHFIWTLAPQHITPRFTNAFIPRAVYRIAKRKEDVSQIVISKPYMIELCTVWELLFLNEIILQILKFSRFGTIIRIKLHNYLFYFILFLKTAAHFPNPRSIYL